MAFLKITAYIASPLAGDIPYLDSIIEFEMAKRQGLAKDIQRHEPAPAIDSVRIPIQRGEFAGVRGIPRCSAPIVRAESDRHEHFAKRIAVEHASLLAPDRRLSVAVGNSWTKSYRLPLRVINADRVVWFASGDRKGILRALRGVDGIGKKRSYGYGRVTHWEAESVYTDSSWFGESDGQSVLMRVLPFDEELMRGVVGWKRWFGGFAPPYWHPDRMRDLACPV